MKPPPFDYIAPHSLDEALEALAGHGPEAKVLAGGQSLVPAMNFRLLQPAVLIDLNPLQDLQYIRFEDGELRIGAMTRQRQVELDPLVAEHAPLLHETMPYVAHVQIRNRGTVGGSLAHADPAAELPVVALALGARLRLRSTRGERWVPAEEFFLGMFTTALEPDEILVEVAFPASPPATGWAFTEFARRRGDYALAGVAAGVTLAPDGACQEARVVLLNVGDGPVAARQAAGLLQGQQPDAEAIEAVAQAVDAEIDPMGNVHASPEYQRHLARVLTRRALTTAVERARAALAG